MQRLLAKTKCFFCNPIIICFLVIMATYTITFYVIMKSQVDFEIKKTDLNNKIEKIVNETCQDVVISWSIFDQKPFVNQYVVGDVIGCRERKKDCAESFKKFNKYWQDPHPVDAKSYEYFNKFNGDEVRFIENIDSLKEKDALYKAIKASNWKIKNTYLMAVRGQLFIDGITRKVLYVFSLSHTEKTKYVCPKVIVEEKLKELYVKARE